MKKPTTTMMVSSKTKTAIMRISEAFGLTPDEVVNIALRQYADAMESKPTAPIRK